MAQRKHMTSHVLTINRTRTQAHHKPDTVTVNSEWLSMEKLAFKNQNM